MKKTNLVTQTQVHNNSYVCHHCGHVLPKEDATVSGFDSQSSSRHVHCPGCGKIIAKLG